MSKYEVLIKAVALIHNLDATVINSSTGLVLAEFTIDPTRNYQPKNG